MSVAEQEVVRQTVGKGADFGKTPSQTPSLTVASLLKQYASQYVKKHSRQAIAHGQSTLAKLVLCRTRALGGHVYRCAACQSETPIPRRSLQLLIAQLMLANCPIEFTKRPRILVLNFVSQSFITNLPLAFWRSGVTSGTSVGQLEHMTNRTNSIRHTAKHPATGVTFTGFLALLGAGSTNLNRPSTNSPQ